MKNIIIAQVPESDRNIYLTIVDGELYSVNYSQGIDDIDLHFMNTEDPRLTQFVYNEISRLGECEFSIDNFFPSPYWDKQVRLIDNAIKLYLAKIERIESMVAKLQAVEKQLEELKAEL